MEAVAVIQAINIIVKLVGAVLNKRDSIRSLNDEIDSFCSLLDAVTSVLMDLKEQVERRPDQENTLYDPLKLLKQGVQDGHEVLEECTKTKRFRARAFSEGYLGKLHTAAHRIQSALGLISTAGVIVQGSLLEGIEDANKKIGELTSMIASHEHDVADLLEKQVVPCMKRLPDQIIQKLIDMGVVENRQDCNEQIKEIAERAQELRNEKTFVEKDLLKQVEALSLAEHLMRQNERNGIPKALIDPITLDRMKDPVMLVQSGNTYDRESLCRCLLWHPNRDPVTGKRFFSKLKYRSNISMRQILIYHCGDATYQKHDDSAFEAAYDRAWNQMNDAFNNNLSTSQPPAVSIATAPLSSTPVEESPGQQSNPNTTPPAPDNRLVQALQTAQTQVDTVRALKSIINATDTDVQNRVEIAQAGGIDSIVKAMQTHGTNAEVQQDACCALRNLTRSDSNDVAIAQAGGIQVIVKAMQTNVKNAGVQEYACGALCNLALNDRNKVAIAQAGGIDAIVKAMETHVEQVAVQQNACGALCILALNDSNKITIAKAKGIDAIVKAMETHVEQVAVQQYACNALWGMAANDSNKVAIAQADGIDSIVKAMQTHVDQVTVQEYACGALWNLALNDRNQVVITQAGGIQVVVKAMQTHVDQVAVQENACGALRNLASNDSNKVAIAQAGGIQVIVKAMQTHVKNAGVQHSACVALCNLAMNESNNKVAIAQANGIQEIVKAMQTHGKTAGVQEYACGALLNLAVNDSNKVAIAQAGGVKVICDAKKNHPKNGTIQFNARKSLAFLER